VFHTDVNLLENLMSPGKPERSIRAYIRG